MRTLQHATPFPLPPPRAVPEHMPRPLLLRARTSPAFNLLVTSSLRVALVLRLGATRHTCGVRDLRASPVG